MTYALNSLSFAEWALPAGASALPTPTAWLAEMYRLIALGEEDAAGILIYDKMDELLFAGRFVAADAVLEAVDRTLDKLPPLYMVGFLTITCGYRHELRYRPTYYRRVEARIRAELPDRADKILVGLA